MSKQLLRPTAGSLVWFRLDLRLADNPALDAAIRRGGAVIPVFIWAPEEEAPWAPGGASRWWLHQSLKCLDDRLRQIGSRLLLRRGASAAILQSLAKETGATAVFWNRRYEPALIERDTKVMELLRADGIETRVETSALLREPWTIENKSGKPFKVFTPFWKHCLSLPDPPEPLPSPKSLRNPPRWPRSDALADLELEPKIPWAEGIRAAWQPGEIAAAARLRTFLSKRVDDYSADRDRPGVDGTSRLSPHLHFGELSARQVWHQLEKAGGKPGAWRRSQFLTELGWREFSHHLLFHFPRTANEPLRPEFKNFPWRKDIARLKAWQKGRTGYPIVDAGMSQLWTTGWMHNRVRMIVASFLVKDLLIDWQQGARWFWDTLVDADLAQNTLGWQWTAGCGADAAPFFRVFNPVNQGRKFDPNGEYVRKWCPELAGLPADYVHEPHKAPAELLQRLPKAGSYPEPIVSHVIAREVALEAFGRLRCQ